jgi:hypothetical protein
VPPGITATFMALGRLDVLSPPARSTDGIASSSFLFRRLCRVLGGHDQSALHDIITAGQLPQLCRMAQLHDQLPALAVRVNEQRLDRAELGEANGELLQRVLHENTRRNLQISAQAIKLTVRLNEAGIVPLFLKGTARLLGTDSVNLGFRQQSDIDMIVRPAELAAAGDVLLADGYRYCQFSGNPARAPRQIADTQAALRLSATHHHLLPLAKQGYVATVELHRHFLDRRFQRANPLEPLFASAHQLERHGAIFQVPSLEYQLIHLVLGKLVTDGHLARRAFPLREACDLIELLQGVDDAHIDQALIAQRCGSGFAQFLALVSELTGFAPGFTVAGPVDISAYLRLLQQRDDSALARALLDAYARVQYLAYALLHSPAKLPVYLSRLLPSD